MRLGVLRKIPSQLLYTVITGRNQMGLIWKEYGKGQGSARMSAVKVSQKCCVWMAVLSMLVQSFSYSVLITFPHAHSKESKFYCFLYVIVTQELQKTTTTKKEQPFLRKHFCSVYGLLGKYFSRINDRSCFVSFSKTQKPVANL